MVEGRRETVDVRTGAEMVRCAPSDIYHLTSTIWFLLSLRNYSDLERALRTGRVHRVELRRVRIFRELFSGHTERIPIPCQASLRGRPDLEPVVDAGQKFRTVGHGHC